MIALILQYAPFKGGPNPCATTLAAVKNDASLALTYNYKDYGNDLVIPPSMK
jgi:hypothetical protein